MSEEKVSDEVLAARAKAGDEEALEKLLERYKPLMRSLAGRYFIRGGDHNDVIQEAMIGLFKAVQTYDPEAGLLFRVAAAKSSEQAIIDAVRKAETKKNRLLNDSLSLDEYPQSGAETLKMPPEAEQKTLHAEEDARTLAEIKDRLSAYEYEIMLLRLEGLSYQEIADKLHLNNAKSVDNALQRVRRKLRPSRQPGQ